MEPSRTGGALLALCVACVASSARAQTDCPVPPAPGPIETTPASGAGGVTRDAWVRVLYTPGYFGPTGPGTGGETITVTDPDGVPVAGDLQVVGDEALFFVPIDLLEPGTRYDVVATGVARELVASFTTGANVDTAPPSIGPITRVSVEPVGPSCTAPSGGHRVGVSFDPATDDGALGSIEYGLYLTRGEGVAGPVRVARQRHFAGSEITAAFVLDDDQAETIVCVSVRAEDGVGRSDEGGGVCFDPVSGAFFAPLCSATTASRTPPGAFALAPILAAAAVAIRRRRRG